MCAFRSVLFCCSPRRADSGAPIRAVPGVRCALMPARSIEPSLARQAPRTLRSRLAPRDVPAGKLRGKGDLCTMHWRWRWHCGIVASLRPGRGILRPCRTGERSPSDSLQRRASPGPGRSHRPRCGQGRGSRKPRRPWRRRDMRRRAGGGISFGETLPLSCSSLQVYIRQNPCFCKPGRTLAFADPMSLCYGPLASFFEHFPVDAQRLVDFGHAPVWGELKEDLGELSRIAADIEGGVHMEAQLLCGP